MILNKTMEDVATAIERHQVVATWGTAVNLFVIVSNTDLAETRLEAWKVTL